MNREAIASRLVALAGPDIVTMINMGDGWPSRLRVRTARGHLMVAAHVGRVREYSRWGHHETRFQTTGRPLRADRDELALVLGLAEDGLPPTLVGLDADAVKGSGVPSRQSLFIPPGPIMHAVRDGWAEHVNTVGESFVAFAPGRLAEYAQSRIAAGRKEVLYHAPDILLPPSAIIIDTARQIEVATVAIAERLKGRPEDVHELTPRQFEQLIGELLTDMRFGRIELTRFTRDGGKDLLAYIDLGGRRVRFTDAERRRLARKAHVLGRKALSRLDTLVTPDTLLRWRRELVAKKWDFSHRRAPGRPRTMNTIVDLVLRMALENRSWGYTRIRGALANLGHDVGRGTIASILHEHGIEPAPERDRHTRWSTFLKAHWECLTATDFLSVEVHTIKGLVTYYILFFIDIASRSVHVAGVTPHPDNRWMTQIARNVTDTADGFLRGTRYLILDRDTKYSDDFRNALIREGVHLVRLPPRSPNLNAFAETLRALHKI